jgi:hypothetical protein
MLLFNVGLVQQVEKPENLLGRLEGQAQFPCHLIP